MALTLSTVKRAKAKDKDYKLYDEKGLFLLIKKTGAKYWRFKYRAARKEKLLALGVFPEVTLTQARIKRDDARKLLDQGEDPSEDRLANKQKRMEAADNSFKSVVEDWIVKRGKRSKTGDERLRRIMDNDLLPTLGRYPVSEITPQQLLATLRKIESRGAINTAHKAKQYAGQVFRFAVACGKAERDPSADLRDALATAKTKHFSAITTPDEAGKLMVAINGYQGTATVIAALKLSALFFCRQGELRHLEWDEINWNERQIELPEEKMKISESHIIPLSRQAYEILETLSECGRRGKYVLPSARGASRPLSENGVRTALRTMGFDNDTMTAHGFRAMARTLLDERLKYPIEWIEQQLAHTVKDTHGRAYNRTKHLDERREMMQKWADYLDNLVSQAVNGNVVIGDFPSSKQTSFG